MLKTLIIDDHKEMRANLHGMLQGFDEIEVIGEASGVTEGLERINSLKPELIFLDVEMQDGTGFDLLSRLGDKTIKVIFVTGHDTYAIKAFKFSAIDYLLKPVDFDELQESITKAALTDRSENSINILLSNKKKLSRLVLSDSQNTYLIDLREIIRVQSDINYATFYLVDEREITVAKTLKSYDELLSASGFFRAHQSHLINLTHFDKLEKGEGGIIRLRTGDAIPLSSRKKEDLHKALAAFAMAQT